MRQELARAVRKGVLVSGVCAALVLGAAANAAVTHFDIQFSGTGPLPTQAGFDWDNSVFSNFYVDWVGLTFDLTSGANDGFTVGFDATGTGCASGGSLLTFALLSGGTCNGAFGASFWSAVSFGGPSGFFTFGAEGDGQPGAQFRASAVSFAGTADPGQRGGGRFAVVASGAAPEPATLTLLGLGLAGLAASRRRKQ